MKYTDEQLALIKLKLSNLSDSRGLDDEYLEENGNTTRSEANICDANSIVVAGGEYVYGIPMIDVDVVLDIMLTYESRIKELKSK